MRYTNRLWIWHRVMLQTAESTGPTAQERISNPLLQLLHRNSSTFEILSLSQKGACILRVMANTPSIFLREVSISLLFVDFLCGCYVNGGKSCTCFCRIFDFPWFSVTIVFKPSYINSSIFSSRYTGQHRGTLQDQENHTTQKTETGLLRSPGII